MNPPATSFILGYHGCDRAVANRVLAGRAMLVPSHNDYDWLGVGIYFWEHNAQRAFEFATELARRPRHAGQRVRTPAVVGAVIDLGFCLNLLDTRFLTMVHRAHHDLVDRSRRAGLSLPRNSVGHDLLKRDLDCAVLRTLHLSRADAGVDPFDTVRAAFVEGEQLYENAGFSAKNHIQVCVRRGGCIKGCFRPLDDDGTPTVFG